jgi:hypothetical protein
MFVFTDADMRGEHIRAALDYKGHPAFASFQNPDWPAPLAARQHNGFSALAPELPIQPAQNATLTTAICCGQSNLVPELTETQESPLLGFVNRLPWQSSQRGHFFDFLISAKTQPLAAN